MRKILLSFMLALAALAAQAQARLVVWEKGGGKVVYQLAEQPTTTFEQGKLVLRTNTATVSYHLENVLRYTYEGVDNSLVDGISLQPEEALVKIEDEFVIDIPGSELLNVSTMQDVYDLVERKIIETHGFKVY